VLLLDDRAKTAPVSGTLFTARLDQGLDTLAASEGLRVTHLPYLVILRR
jgi:ferric-dicitrate binding protein FerR (iron transport regulator)